MTTGNGSANFLAIPPRVFPVKTARDRVKDVILSEKVVMIILIFFLFVTLFCHEGEYNYDILKSSLPYTLLIIVLYGTRKVFTNERIEMFTRIHIIGMWLLTSFYWTSFCVYNWLYAPCDEIIPGIEISFCGLDFSTRLCKFAYYLILSFLLTSRMMVLADLIYISIAHHETLERMKFMKNIPKELLADVKEKGDELQTILVHGDARIPLRTDKVTREVKTVVS